MTPPPGREGLSRRRTRAPYRDERGDKGWLAPFAHAQPHRVIRLELAWPAALRVAFLSDFHVGSHTDDVARLSRIVSEAATYKPDLVLYGGDFVNTQRIGGGRVPPHTIAGILGEIDAPLGRFAVLGNHDYAYDARAVASALREAGIALLDDTRHGFPDFDLIGLPDARKERPSGRAQIAALDKPAIVLAHDPFWFRHLPAGPHLMLAGHTHGGQVRLPVIGPLVNLSHAPLRWTYGLIEEGGRRMYVTSGLGGIPLRFRCPPEFVIADLKPA